MFPLLDSLIEHMERPNTAAEALTNLIASTNLRSTKLTRDSNAVGFNGRHQGCRRWTSMAQILGGSIPPVVNHRSAQIRIAGWRNPGQMDVEEPS